MFLQNNKAQLSEECTVLKKEILTVYKSNNYNDFDEKIHLFEKFIQQADSLDCQQARATAMVVSGNYYKENGEYKLARRMYADALFIREDISDTAGILSIRNNSISLEAQSGFPNHAIKIYEEVEQYFQNLGKRAEVFSYKKIKIYNNAAGAYRKVGNHVKAKKLYKEAMKLSGGVNAISLHGLGDVEFDLTNFEDALAYYEKAVSLYKEKKNDYLLSILSRSKAFCYLGEKDTIEAARFLLQSARIADKIDNVNLLADAILKMIEIGMGHEGNEDVQNYISKLIKKGSIDFGSFKEKSKLLKVISDKYYKYGNADLAYYMQRKAASLLNDSLMRKVEKEVELRGEIEKKVAVAEKQKLIKNLIITIFFIVLIAIFYIRRKELSSIQLEKDKNQLELSMVKSRLSIEHELRSKLAIETHDIKTVVAAVRNNADFAKSQYKTYNKLGTLLETTYTLSEQILSRIVQLNKALQPDKNEWYKNLKSLLDGIASDGSLETEIKVDIKSIDKIDTKTGFIVLNIVSVLLDNIKEHAKASKVSIDILDNSNQLFIKVIDDGIGNFDSLENKGLGLKSVYMRVDALKGHINIDTATGTNIQLSLPLISKKNYLD